MIFVPLLLSFLVAFVSAPFLRELALRWGIVDVPCEARKLHKGPVPLLGGAAVYLGTVVGGLAVCLFDPPILRLLIGATLIFIVSLIDDKRELSARLRMAVQVLAASILIVSGMRISFLPNNFFGDAGEVLITFLWILGITNAFNYLDGLDGLCCGLGAITAFFFFIVLYATGQSNLVSLSLVLIGACLGFVPHNFKKEKMFLGDAGSMFLGYMMAGIALLGDWASDSIIKISVPILILGVPIFDMTFTTLMRWKERKIHTLIQWLEYAGRDHFHHYLMDLGLRAHGTAFFIFAINISMGITAVIITQSDKPLYGFLAILKGIIMFGLIGVLMVMGRRLQKEHQVKERMGI